MSVAQLAGGRPSTIARRAGRKSALLVISIVVLAVVALVAVIGPLIAPYDPNALYVGPISAPPTLEHWLGTDDLGRDILSRLLVGTRASVLSPVFVVLFSTFIGGSIAVLGAWFGGFVDAAIGRIIDVIFAIPGLVLAVLAVAMFGKGLIAPVLALSIAYVPVVARLVRTAALVEIGKPYIAALRVQGVSTSAVWSRHLLPALVPTVSAAATVGFGYAMLDLAAISYLGLGEQPPAADWGVMVSEGQAAILQGAPEQALFASLVIVVTVLAVNIAGARVTDWAEGGDR